MFIETLYQKLLAYIVEVKTVSEKNDNKNLFLLTWINFTFFSQKLFIIYLKFSNMLSKIHNEQI